MTAPSPVSMSDPPIKDVLATLEKAKPIRLEFEGGRLHIDRPLPFLSLHGGDADNQPVAHELAASEASYILTGNVDDAVHIIKPIADAMRKQFGHSCCSTSFAGKIDHTTSCRKDGLRGTVVAVEHDDVRGSWGKLFREIQNVADGCGAEGIDRLRVVTDHRQSTEWIQSSRS